MLGILRIFLLLLSFDIYALSEIDKRIVFENKLVGERVSQRPAAVEKVEKIGENTYFKDQLKSLVKWSEVSDVSWLDIYDWTELTKLKQADPHFSIKYRAHKNNELVGRVLKCFGVCYRYRGNLRNSVSYQSRVYEGDEVYTISDSALYIITVDGSIVRLASSTSVSFNEFNISKTKMAFYIRLNKGYVQFRPRNQNTFEAQDKPETDLGMFPLKLLEANREQFMRLEYQALNEEQKSFYESEENPGFKSHYKKLNELIKKNNKKLGEFERLFFVYSPNISLEFYDRPLDLFYEPNGKSIYYYGQSLEGALGFSGFQFLPKVGLRGHQNKDFTDSRVGQWLEVDRSGSKISKHFSRKNLLEASRNILKRVPTVQLAAELWLKNKERDLFLTKDNRGLANEFGYRLWNDDEKEMERRLEFAKEYIRRVETTNLVSLSVFLKESPVREYNISFYSKTMEAHYKALKERFKLSRINVKNMTRAQYYLWILNND